MIPDPGGATFNAAEYKCYHCGSQCGGRLDTGYAALGGEFTGDGRIHAVCSPGDPGSHPDCWTRVAACGERAGALRSVRPLPAGTGDIRAG